MAHQPEQYWNGVRENCQNIVWYEWPAPELAYGPLLTVDQSTYHWEGAYGDQVTLRVQYLFALQVGAYALHNTSRYYLEFAGKNNTFRTLHFDPHAQRIAYAYHGVRTPERQEDDSTLSGAWKQYRKWRRELREGYWVPRPRDYERLSDELARGAQYRADED